MVELTFIQFITGFLLFLLMLVVSIMLIYRMMKNRDENLEHRINGLQDFESVKLTQSYLDFILPIESKIKYDAFIKNLKIKIEREIKQIKEYQQGTLEEGEID